MVKPCGGSSADGFGTRVSVPGFSCTACAAGGRFAASEEVVWLFVPPASGAAVAGFCASLPSLPPSSPVVFSCVFRSGVPMSRSPAARALAAASWPACAASAALCCAPSIAACPEAPKSGSPPTASDAPASPGTAGGVGACGA